MPTDSWAASTEELAPQDVIPAALAAGALTPEQVVREGVMVDQVGRSHPVHRVSVGGTPRFFLKSFGPRRGHTDGRIECERGLHALAAERPAIAALVPPPWQWDGQERVVATAAVAGREAWSLDHLGGGAATVAEAWSKLAHAVAGPLAAFHRSTRDLAKDGAEFRVFDGPEPWPLRLMDGDGASELWATPATAEILAEAAADPAVVAGLRSARALWRRLSLIHGDLKHDNVLVADQGGTQTVKIVDWEMARLGDPAWDLAVLATRLATARDTGRPWPDEDLAGAALLVSLHSNASGLAAPPLARRLILYSAAALLMVSLQHVSTLAPDAERSGAKRLLMKARSTFRRADRLTAALLDRCD